MAVDSMMIPLVAIAGGLVAGTIIVLGVIVRAIAISRAREQTKRELAAYVAEGTMDPDTAIALAKAGTSEDDDGDDLS
jgi:hypothetical protein